MENLTAPPDSLRGDQSRWPHGRAFRLRVLCLVALASAMPMVAAEPQDAGAYQLRRVGEDGLGDPRNTGIVSMATSGERLFVGSWNVADGCQVLEAASNGEARTLGERGIASPSNFATSSLQVFNGRLYAGTWNIVEGGALFRAAGDLGGQWERIVVPGLEGPDYERVSRLIVFRDHLYLASYNLHSGPAIWRSATGDSRDWQRVSPETFGDPSNSDVTAGLVAGDRLYLGTEALRPPVSGAQLLRTNADPASPETMWEAVNRPGFGKRANQHIGGLAAWDGWLYAGTWNGDRGLEVWRAPLEQAIPFRGWEAVAYGGITHRAYTMTTDMARVGDVLLLGARGRFESTGDPFSADVKVAKAAGGALFRTADGTTWEQIRGEGFLASPVLGVQCLRTVGERTWIGTFALDHPAQLWVYEQR